MPAAFRLIGVLLIASLALAHGLAAQPFVVDDTGLAPEGAVQMEAWHQPSASWFVPSAQVARGVDLVGGLALLHDSPLGAEQVAVDLQSKWQLRPMQQRWSAAVVAGATAELPSTGVRAADPLTTYAYVPLGLAARGGRLIAHANAGWTYAQGGAHEITWSFRADVRMGAAVTVVGEAYGAGTALPGYQAGLQLYPGADWLELNVTVSNDVRGDRRRTWLTLGLVAVVGTAP